MSDQNTREGMLRMYVTDMRRDAERARFYAGDFERVAAENATKAANSWAQAKAIEAAADLIEASLLKAPVGS